MREIYPLLWASGGQEVVVWDWRKFLDPDGIHGGELGRDNSSLFNM